MALKPKFIAKTIYGCVNGDGHLVPSVSLDERQDGFAILFDGQQIDFVWVASVNAAVVSVPEVVEAHLQHLVALAERRLVDWKAVIS